MLGMANTKWCHACRKPGLHASPNWRFRECIGIGEKKITLLNLQGAFFGSSPKLNAHISSLCQMQSSFILAKNARAADGDNTIIDAAISTSLPGNAALLAFQLKHSSVGPEGGLLHH